MMVRMFQEVLCFYLTWSSNSYFSVTTGVVFSSKVFMTNATLVKEDLFQKSFLPTFWVRNLIEWKLQNVLSIVNVPEIQTLFLRKYRLNFINQDLNRKPSAFISALHWNTVHSVLNGWKFYSPKSPETLDFRPPRYPDSFFYGTRE